MLRFGSPDCELRRRDHNMSRSSRLFLAIRPEGCERTGPVANHGPYRREVPAIVRSPKLVLLGQSMSCALDPCQRGRQVAQNAGRAMLACVQAAFYSMRSVEEQ